MNFNYNINKIKYIYYKYKLKDKNIINKFLIAVKTLENNLTINLLYLEYYMLNIHKNFKNILVYIHMINFYNVIKFKLYIIRHIIKNNKNISNFNKKYLLHEINKIIIKLKNNHNR
ncbi:unknown similar to AMEV117 [Mythimna separata entomopoxvirus 'L']|uniref:Uncharacterized protein n=1 Tax=Mythimna separata entomopoxvirus 'L' TaxID=1293572 RepID=A0A916KQ72_9POXV|nr:unknown similar to AMEV117 [Mythimna separata entomopoxvirus 'L']CCU56330.1 unknown similar to AMEV117 [Mythimna separata entomopoxvirus 'L']